MFGLAGKSVPFAELLRHSPGGPHSSPYPPPEMALLLSRVYLSAGASASGRSSEAAAACRGGGGGNGAACPLRPHGVPLFGLSTSTKARPASCRRPLAPPRSAVSEAATSGGLTENQIADFQRDGFLHIPGSFAARGVTRGGGGTLSSLPSFSKRLDAYIYLTCVDGFRPRPM